MNNFDVGALDADQGSLSPMIDLMHKKQDIESIYNHLHVRAGVFDRNLVNVYSTCIAQFQLASFHLIYAVPNANVQSRLVKAIYSTICVSTKVILFSSSAQ